MATTNKAFRVKTGLIVEGAELKPAAGTTSYPPILLTSGTNLTTATAGAFEYDGTNFYLTPTAGNRKTIAFTDLAVSQATSSVLGTIKLSSDTAQTVAINAVSAIASRSYGLQVNGLGQGIVNVPWTDTDTNWYPTTFTYTNGTTAGPTGSLSGTGMSAVSFGAIPSASGSVSGIVTTDTQTFAGVKTFTSPSITTSLTSASATFDLLATPTTINIGTAATTMTVGNTATGAQTVNMFTSATAGGTYNIATAASSSGTKAINIGTTGTTGSTTTIVIGTTAGTTPTITLNGAVTLGTTGLVGPATMAAFNTVSTSLSIGGAATTFNLGSTSAGTTTVQAGTTLNLNAPAVNSNAATLALFATPTTVTAFGAGTTIGIGAATGNTTVNNNLVVSGNLTVNGITTTVNSNTVQVDDKNLELGSVSSGVVSTTGTIGSITGSGPYTSTITGMSSTTGLIVGQEFTATSGTGAITSTPTVASIVSNTSITFTSSASPSAGTVTNISGSAASDSSANGGGITLKGSTDKTLTWSSTGGNWTSSENLSLATGKTFKINNAEIISGTAAALVVGAGASTSISIGNAAGTASILNPIVTLTNATTLNINGATQSIVGGTVAGTASVFNTNTGTVNFGGAASIVNIGGGADKTTNIAGTGASLINIGSTNIGNTNTSIVTIGSGGAGTGAKQQIVVGSHLGNTGVYETYIGATTLNSFTTIQGTVNLPSVGTSGFVKLGTNGILSADTATYISSSSPTISSPTLTGTVYLDDGAVVTTTFTTSGTTVGASPAIFDTTVFTGAEIVIKAKNGTTLEVIKALVLIDSTGNVYNTQYADILTGTQLIGTLNYTTTSNEFKISITPFAGTTGTTTYKAVLTLLEA